MKSRKRDWIEFFFVDHIVATLACAALVMSSLVMSLILTVAYTVSNHSDEIGHGIGHFARQVSDGYHSNQHN